MLTSLLDKHVACWLLKYVGDLIVNLALVQEGIIITILGGSIHWF